VIVRGIEAVQEGYQDRLFHELVYFDDGWVERSRVRRFFSVVE